MLYIHFLLFGVLLGQIVIIYPLLSKSTQIIDGGIWNYTSSVNTSWYHIVVQEDITYKAEINDTRYRKPALRINAEKPGSGIDRIMRSLSNFNQIFTYPFSPYTPLYSLLLSYKAFIEWDIFCTVEDHLFTYIFE